MDDAGTGNLYIDNFKVWSTGSSEPADQPTPTPAPTVSPTPSGFADAQNWTWYE
jgi:hypothetical protein